MNHCGINNISVIGGNFFERDESGNPKHPIATAFPKYRLIVTQGRIHALQTNSAYEFLRQHVPPETAPVHFDSLCYDAVPLNISKDCVIIRTDRENMDKAIAADELLQQIVPKGKIQFTGLKLPEVRDVLGKRGEIWRISPAPFTETDFADSIRQSRIKIGTDALFYHNRHTGEHFITYEECLKIRQLFFDDEDEASDRIQEIVELSQMINRQHKPELSFLLPEGVMLKTDILIDILNLLQDPAAENNVTRKKALCLFDTFLKMFFDLAGPDMQSDNTKNDQWRSIMLSRLYCIDEETTTEWALGLGPEFYLNINWLPGARIKEGQLIFEPNALPRVKRLIQYYYTSRKQCIAINVGRSVSSLSQRDRSGEEREVFIVALELEDGRKEIRHVRMSKWDVHHRIKQGLPMDRAISETCQYRDYIVDRLKAAQLLGLPIPNFEEIYVEEEFENISIPVFYFERDYITGLITNRISPNYYGRKDFIIRLTGLLGISAAVSLVLGRSDPRTGQIYFDDGDEVIQLDKNGLPSRLLLIESTGSFNDWTTPISDLLPFCLEELKQHFLKAKNQGASLNTVNEAVSAFSDTLTSEIHRMQKLLDDPSISLESLFADRTNENGGIRCRWEAVLHRLAACSLTEIEEIIHHTLRLRKIKTLDNKPYPQDSC